MIIGGPLYYIKIKKKGTPTEMGFFFSALLNFHLIVIAPLYFTTSEKIGISKMKDLAEIKHTRKMIR